jgi:hypothetical protein
MTKSKGIGRGGHRKGAGRPPEGKTSYFSTRLTPKTRSLLEAEARRRGKSLSEVAEDLLQLGLEEIAELGRPKPLRALLFLIESLSNFIRDPHQQDAKYSWHSNPYVFAALRAGIIDLLDRLRPSGEIVTPPPGPEEMGEDEEGSGLFRHTFPDSPEEHARNIVDMLILQARARDFNDEIRKKYGLGIRPPRWPRLHYGFVDAHRDLLATQWRKQK